MNHDELMAAAEYVLSNGASEDYHGGCCDADDCSICDEHRRKMREYPKMFAATILLMMKQEKNPWLTRLDAMQRA